MKTITAMWMPAGINTANVRISSGSIDLTVKCAKETVAFLNGELSKIKSPFGCLRHQEAEATFKPIKFIWRESGIFLKMRLTPFGVRALKKHKFIGATFKTNAEYLSLDKEGSIGSKANPADIDGISPAVGTLTANPSFNVEPIIK